MKTGNTDSIARLIARELRSGNKLKTPAPAGTRPQGGDCEAGSMRSTSDAVTGEAGQAPNPNPGESA